MKRRRLLAVILSFATVMSLMPMRILSVSAEENIYNTVFVEDNTVRGNGTEANPYQISTLGQLERFRDSVNNGTTYEGIYIKQTKNIDLSGAYGESVKSEEDGENKENSWSPIGTEEKPFKGSYDGNGFVIQNIYLSTDKLVYNMALFGYAKGAVIKNLGLTGKVYAPKAYYVGGIVANASSTTIENCYNKSSVTGKVGVGGIIGKMYENCKIIKCYNTGAIESVESVVGGIGGAGDTGDIVEYCYNTGSVKGGESSSDGSNGAGGILGTAYSCTVKNSYNTGNVTSKASNKGGVVGTKNNSCAMSALYYTSDKLNDIGTKVTEEQLKSGEIAYLMNEEKSNQSVVWKQTIGKENTPNYWGRTVYKSGDAYQNAVLNQNADGVYEISTAQQLIDFRELVNASEGAKLNAVLMADIDLEGIEWRPIGVNYGDFTGVFDGNGHTVSNMSLTPVMNGYGGHPTYDYQGFFGIMRNGAVIKNFTITGTINLASDNVNQIGGVIGRAYESSRVENVVSKVKITDGDKVYSYIYAVGGVVGYLGNTYLKNTSADVINCRYEGEMDIDTVSAAGGIAGFAMQSSNVKESVNRGNITTNYMSHIGGVIGSAQSGTTVEKCMNFGNVLGKRHDCIGGIAGYANENVTIKDCGNYGNITGEALEDASEKDIYVGGILGYVNNKSFGGLTNCLNYGTISAPKGKKYCGAIVGWLRDADLTKIKDNYYSDTSCEKAFGDKSGSATAITAQKLESGEFAYEMQRADQNTIWGQTLFGENKTSAPTVGGEKVYKVTFMSENKEYAVCYANETGIGVLPDAPGEKFAKWLVGQTADSNEFTETTPISEDITVYAFKNDTTKPVEGVSYEIEIRANNEVNINLVDYVVSEIGLKNNISFSIKSGKLPTGLAFENGVIKGKTNELGVFSVTFNVINSGIALYGLDETGEELTLTLNVSPFAGKGTKEDPYKISNLKDMECFRDCVNNGNSYENIFIKLASDINLGGSENPWTPIGTQENPFKGSFDGGGYNITELYINDTAADYQGLFGYVGTGATVEKIIVNGEITAKDNIGLLAGRSDGTVINCASIGTVKGGDNVGGLVGIISYSVMKNCYSISDVECTGRGGILLGHSDDTDAEKEQAKPENCFYRDNGESNVAIINEYGTNKSTADFEEGAVAYLLQSGQTADENGKIEEVWGQTLSGDGKNGYPVIGGEKVHKCRSGYTNPFKIVFAGNWVEGTFIKSFYRRYEIYVPKPGIYEVMTVSYYGNKLLEIRYYYINAETAGTYERKEVVIGSSNKFRGGEKVMLWDGCDTMIPLCEPYVVKQ